MEHIHKRFTAEQVKALVNGNIFGRYLKGYRCIHPMLSMDDFSRTVLAARLLDSDSTVIICYDQGYPFPTEQTFHQATVPSCRKLSISVWL